MSTWSAGLVQVGAASGAHAAAGRSFRKLLEVVKDRISIERLAQDLGAELGSERGGGERRGRGVCHGGENPTALAVYPDEGRWHCFRCNEGGDVLDLFERAHGYTDSKTALIELAGHYGCLDDPRLCKPASWYRKQRRQKPIRAAIEQARIEHIQRRAFRVWCEPLLEAIDDPDQRREDGEALWAAMRPVAVALFEGMRRW